MKSGNQNKWDVRFLELAKSLANWSLDPSSKIGAVAISDKRQVLATGYNGFPRGIADIASRYSNREIKYKYVVHAEMNVIYNATYNGVSLDGATLYIHGINLCSECAKGVIQVGIKRVVMPMNNLGRSKDKIWSEHWEFSKNMLQEAGVKYKFINMPDA